MKLFKIFLSLIFIGVSSSWGWADERLNEPNAIFFICHLPNGIDFLHKLSLLILAMLYKCRYYTLLFWLMGQ